MDRGGVIRRWKVNPVKQMIHCNHTFRKRVEGQRDNEKEESENLSERTKRQAANYVIRLASVGGDDWEPERSY